MIFRFEIPLVWQIGLPLALAAMSLVAFAQRRRGLSRASTLASFGLRGAAIAALVLLAAQPVWVELQDELERRRAVLLLVDRSASMSLEDQGISRHRAALAFAREQLLPGLQSAKLPIRAFLFADDIQPVDGAALARSTPDGNRTDLAAAVSRAAEPNDVVPVAIVALTDGIATERAHTNRALATLIDQHVPFIAVGFGSDTGSWTLALRQAMAPPAAPLSQQFQVSAQLETNGDAELPAFELVLLRNGQFLQKKTVPAGKGARTWIESFTVTESAPGVYAYTIELLPPTASGLRVFDTKATSLVRISGENDLRVLYAQGALTWDYKFISRALQKDPTIKLTGLSRTTNQSFFYQNIEDSSLKSGFPSSLSELAPFRVAVLSNLRPSDLSAAQQDLLARFCGEFGGGILLIGGANTFDASWHSSRFEQLLPVRFAPSGTTGGEQPFRFEPTAEALEHPVFQIADRGSNRTAWARLPRFTLFARVDGAKPGATVWAQHPEESGSSGRRVLMATQRYGSGISAALCVQNFWRWRLAKESNVDQFDRFWLQLFRFLSEGTQESIAIRLADQELRPGIDVRISVEKRPDPNAAPADRTRHVVRVESESRQPVHEQTVELVASRPVDLSFRADRAGVHTVSVLDSQGVSRVSRPIEIRATEVEFQRTARNMEALEQWAALTNGLALRAEDCPNADELVRRIEQHIADAAQRREPVRKPAGMNGWILMVLLALLGGEWLMRKQWGMA